MEKEKKLIIQVFQLNYEKGEFEELELEKGVQLYEILNSKLKLFFISPEIYRSYIWVGSEVSTRERMIYIAREKACSIRDRLGGAIKLIALDQNDETLLFKIMIGLEKGSLSEELAKPPMRGLI
jgi:hypothetical protein